MLQEEKEEGEKEGTASKTIFAEAFESEEGTRL